MRQDADMRVSLIVALAAGGVIGRDNRLPWRLPADLRRFKALTMGHALVMGRKTYESIGRPLPGRRTVVITRQPGWTAPGIDPGDPGDPGIVQVVPSLEAALRAARGDSELFIAGGGEIFAQALPVADRIYRTRIEAAIPGDAFFPELDEAAWRIVEQEHHDASDENPYPFTFEVLDRA